MIVLNAVDVISSGLAFLLVELVYIYIGYNMCKDDFQRRQRQYLPKAKAAVIERAKVQAREGGKPFVVRNEKTVVPTHKSIARLIKNFGFLNIPLMSRRYEAAGRDYKKLSRSYDCCLRINNPERTGSLPSVEASLMSFMRTTSLHSNNHELEAHPHANPNSGLGRIIPRCAVRRLFRAASQQPPQP